MPQDWVLPAASDSLFESYTPLMNAFAALRSMFSGTALPASDLVAHMLAVETTGGTINQRSSDNAAWLVQGLVDQRFWGLGSIAPQVKTITSDAESSDMIRSHIDVQDRGGQALLQRHVFDVWVGTSDMGAPSATGNTVSFNKGVILQTIVANAHYQVICDANGEIELDLTVSGAATRYVMARLGSAPIVSKTLTFAA